ncbi:MAG: phage holin family protein [Oscillospiraceae bacterium]|nr:phage holin family protein [Oscillospiraceae bacterium]
MQITEIITAMIALLAAIITAVVVPWLRKKAGALDTTELLAWVEVAVAAAEQLYESTNGAAKKDYVLDVLEAQGYYVDTAEVDAAIEAAVLALHHALQEDAA